MTQVESRSELGSLTFALADDTRRKLFEVIAHSPGLTTSELVERAPHMSRWGVIKHMDVLRAAGLVQTMASGRWRRHYPEMAALHPLRTWIEHVTSDEPSPAAD